MRVSRKDKNRPRGRMNPYAFYVQDCRKNAGGGVDFAQFSKQCSQGWNSMSMSEKRQYEEMAKKDRMRYEREMKNYVPPPGLPKRRKRMKDPNAPKRPPSAFILFSAEHRPRMMRNSPSRGVTDIARQLGQLWSQQGQREKAQFENKAQQLRQRYEVQMRAYRARGGPKRFKESMKMSARDRKAAKKAKKGRGRPRKAGRRKAARRRVGTKRGRPRKAGRRRATGRRRAPKRRAARKSRSRSGSR